MSRGIGIDIGADTVKVAQVRVKGSHVELLGAASFSRHSLGVDGSDANALARAAAARAAELGFRNGAAVAGITGRDVILRYMSVPPAPLWKLRQLMDYEVGEITGADPREFACDFRPLNLPQRAIDEFLLLVAVSRNQLLEERIASFGAGRVHLECLCPDSAALFNAFARSVEADPREYVALLDVGAEKTEVVLMRNQSFVFARNVMPGGREFTEAIAETLDVSAERAEEIKHRRGAVLTPDEIKKYTGQETEFYDALHAVAGQLVGSVQSTLMFARTQTKLTQLEPARYYLSGGAARLAGLREHLASALGKPVEWLDVGAGMAHAATASEAAAEQPSPYAVALGLALTAASPNAFALRLLPERVRRRRHFVRKGVFAWAAAAMALLAVAAGLLGNVHNWRVARDTLASVRQGIKAAAKENGRSEDVSRDIEDRRRKINLLADQVRANALLVNTLGALKQHATEAITISVLRFGSDAGRTVTGEAPARFMFHLEGVAAKRGALDPSEELDEFRHRLKGSPLAARAFRERRTAMGDKIEVQIDFTPSEAPAEPPSPVSRREESDGPDTLPRDPKVLSTSLVPPAKAARPDWLHTQSRIGCGMPGPPFSSRRDAIRGVASAEEHADAGSQGG